MAGREFVVHTANATVTHINDTNFSTLNVAPRTGASVTVSCAQDSVWFIICQYQLTNNGSNDTTYCRMLETTTSSIMWTMGRDVETVGGQPQRHNYLAVQAWKEPTGATRNFQTLFGGVINVQFTRSNMRLLALRAHPTDVYTLNTDSSTKTTASTATGFLTAASLQVEAPASTIDYLFFSNIELMDVTSSIPRTRLLFNASILAGPASTVSYPGERKVNVENSDEIGQDIFIWKQTVNTSCTIQHQVVGGNNVQMRFRNGNIIGLNLAAFQQASVVYQTTMSVLASTLNANVSAGNPNPVGVYPMTMTWTPTGSSTVTWQGMYASRNIHSDQRSFMAHEIDGTFDNVSQEVTVFSAPSGISPFPAGRIDTLGAVQRTQKSFLAAGSTIGITQWNGIMWALELNDDPPPAPAQTLVSMIFSISA